MAIENFDEVKSYFESNKDNEEVKNYIGGFLTPDRIENFLGSEAGKKILQPKLDTYHTKGLKTWQDNNLQKLIDDAVSKANPKETPEQKQIRELTERLNKKELQETKGQLTNKALKIAQEKKLPSDLIDYFVGQDEETTTKNLEKLESVFTAHVNAVAEERLKGGYKPPKTDTKLTSEEQVLAEMSKYFNV